MSLFRRRPKSDPYGESLGRSVPATATVVSGKQVTEASPEVMSSSEVFEVELDVVRADGTAQGRQTVRWTVFDVAIPDIQPGTVLSVTVDPERPAVVYPPGYPPPGHRPGMILRADARILPTSKWLEELLTGP